MAPPDGAPPPPVPRSHHDRSAPRSALATSTKGRSVRKKLRHKRHAVASCGSVHTFDSISENEESLPDGDFDKDMAYAVHIDPNAALGDEAAVAALFAEDTEDEGIQDTVKETSYPPDGTAAGSNVADDAKISSAFAPRRREDKEREGKGTPKQEQRLDSGDARGSLTGPAGMRAGP